VQPFLVVIETSHPVVITSSSTPPAASVEARVPPASAGVPPARNEGPSLESGFQILLRSANSFPRRSHECHAPCSFVPMSDRDSGASKMLYPRRARAHSRSHGTLPRTTPPHSQRVLSLPSIAQMIKEPQRLEKNRELYSKAVNSKQPNSLNTAININSKGMLFLFISSIFSLRLDRFSRVQLLSKPKDSDGTGDESVAAQQYSSLAVFIFMKLEFSHHWTNASYMLQCIAMLPCMYLSLCPSYRHYWTSFYLSTNLALYCRHIRDITSLTRGNISFISSHMLS